MQQVQTKLNSFLSTGVYKPESLEPIKKEIIRYQSVNPESVETCSNLLSLLELKLSRISCTLLPIHSRLVDLKLELESLDSTPFKLSKVTSIQQELLQIDNARIDGKFVSNDHEILPGQGEVINLLEECFQDVQSLLEQCEDEDNDSNPMPLLYQELTDIKSNLQDLSSVINFTTTSIKPIEIDLIHLQVQLGTIDSKRVDGKFIDQFGNIPKGQAILHSLLAKCYKLVSTVQNKLEMSTPISDDLFPIYSNLLTLKNCFLELVRLDVQLSSRELLPFQLKLSGIDNSRVDGKFLVLGEIPEGQAVLHDLLDENYQLLETLQNCIED